MYNRSTAFHHWFCEFLTQLQTIDQHIANPERDVNIIIPADSPSWVYESLDHLGYDQNSIVDWSGEPMRINRLFVPIPRFVSGVDGWKIFSQSACQWLRDRLQVKAKKESTMWGETPQRVYISRNDAAQRRVDNEAELVESLNQYGFEKYQLTQLSILDQVSLFSNADLVLAPHGAGLTNIVYSEDLTVIELFGDPETDIKIGPHYCLLSNALDFDYRYLICESNDKDIIVNPATIEKTINSIKAEV
jgi:capsular polysaccharide biosynthesis protein